MRLSNCITCYLVAVEVADLLIILEIILRPINVDYFPWSFLDITPVCSILSVLSSAATDCSVWFTVIFCFDRFVVMCCQKMKIKYCTEKTAALILATTSILLLLKNIPFYFVYQPEELIGSTPRYCSLKPRFKTEPKWMAFSQFDTILTPLSPFVLIIFFNTLTARHILLTSRVRKGLRRVNKGKNPSDPEMQSRRKSVILLFAISGSFILL
ncbi:uncharacterized protein LOC125488045 [Rhincodon typus]|uniref:uncharacterized protein LOC125488045 n=1 Tax=Rhincodon typus TaxID=259920 RepID=UPI00203071B7|nr:uncharacterized protein LOC125488045 [Rhincodon typus]